MKKILILFLFIPLFSSAQSSEWKKFTCGKDSAYLLDINVDRDVYYFGVSSAKMIPKTTYNMTFEKQTKQFLWFKPRRIIKIKVILK
jgi:hypothetical protein